jgi:uncharacterized membrane protein YhaH (DUF805 family)
MSIVQQQCPACAAPLPVQPGQRRLKCDYCASALSVERHGDEISLELAEQVIDKLQQSGAQTQAEFTRMRLTQELHSAEMRLANVQSEMRSIQRSTMNTISRNHLNELHQESQILQKQIAGIKAQLYPDAQPVHAEQSNSTPQLTLDRLVWLLFTFGGRATRGEFWIGAGITFTLFLVGLLINSLLDAIPGEGAADSFFGIVLTVLTIVMIWSSIAVGVKRFQDRDKPGWWVLIGLIPVIGIFWLLFELGIQPGTPGPNRYG